MSVEGESGEREFAREPVGTGVPDEFSKNAHADAPEGARDGDDHNLDDDTRSFPDLSMLQAAVAGTLPGQHSASQEAEDRARAELAQRALSETVQMPPIPAAPVTPNHVPGAGPMPTLAPVPHENDVVPPGPQATSFAPEGYSTADLRISEYPTQAIPLQSWNVGEQEGAPATEGTFVHNLVAEEIIVEKPAKRRNMFAATSVGLGIFVLALGAAYVDPRAFAFVLYFFLIAGFWELRSAFARQGRVISVVPLSVATVGIGVSVWYTFAEGLVVGVIVSAGGLIVWRLMDERLEFTMADAMANVLALAWLPFLGSFMFLMAIATNGFERIVIFVTAVAANDTGALFAGMALGKRKLAPKISPKKTWEGAIGGVLFAGILGTLAAYYLLDQRWWVGIAVALPVAIVSIFGDLAESAIKRDTKIKDMSSILPGHGGVLDRLDSVLLAAPVGYIIFASMLGSL